MSCNTSSSQCVNGNAYQFCYWLELCAARCWIGSHGCQSLEDLTAWAVPGAKIWIWRQARGTTEVAVIKCTRRQGRSIFFL